MDLHNLNDALRELESVAIRTDEGVYVRMEDVRRLMNRDTEEPPEESPPKTIEEARQQAKEYLEREGVFAPQTDQLSVSSQPQTSSRT